MIDVTQYQTETLKMLKNSLEESAARFGQYSDYTLHALICMELTKRGEF